MDFKRWQIEKIRSRLNAYRQHAGVNGHAKPWKSLLWDILAHDDTVNELNEDGSPPHFKQEALRRFGNGVSDLEYAKLNDIYTFLVAKKYLSTNELDENPYNVEKALMLHGYLAFQSNDTSILVTWLSRRYVARKRENGSSERLSLTLDSDLYGKFLRAETTLERYRDTKTAPGLFDAKDKGKQLNTKKKGFAFICTKQKLLHIFVHGLMPDDLTTYIQFVPFSNLDDFEKAFILDIDEVEKLFLIRVGEDRFSADDGKEEHDREIQKPVVIEFKNLNYKRPEDRGRCGSQISREQFPVRGRSVRGRKIK